MKLSELKEQINADLNINKTNLTSEIATGPLLYTKYVHLGSEINLEIKKVEIELGQVTTKRWLFYSGKGSGKVSPTIYNASDLKRVLENDPEVVTIKQRLILLELKKEITDEAVKAFSQRNFSLSNIVKWEMFIGGQV